MNSVLNPLGSTTIEMYLKQGAEEERRTIAIKMLKRGRPLIAIIEDTEFSEEFIRELAKKYKLNIKE